MIKKICFLVLLYLIRAEQFIYLKIRYLYLKLMLSSIGKNSYICKGVKIYGHENIIIGNNVNVNDDVILQSCEGAKIKIGNNVTISYRAMLITGGFRINQNGDLVKNHIGKDIVIEDDVWIGAGAIILPGVIVKKGAIIAAGAIVAFDVPEYSLVKRSVPKIIKLK
jgi:maltose O-acetyltransferase